MDQVKPNPRTKLNEGFLHNILNKLKLRSQSRRFTFSIMVVGLDNSGKTSLIDIVSELSKRARNTQSGLIAARSTPDLSSSRLLASSRPTVGYNYDFIQYNNSVGFNVLDFSGNSKYRDLWLEYYCGVDAIIFVIDSSNPIRFVVARDELDTMLSNPFFSSLRSAKMLTHKPINTEVSAKSEIRMNNNELLIDSRMPRIEPQKLLRISNGRLIESPLDTAGKPGNPCELRTRIPILFLANKCDLSSSVDVTSIIKALNLTRIDTNRHPWHIQSTSSKTTEGLIEALDWLTNILIDQD